MICEKTYNVFTRLVIKTWGYKNTTSENSVLGEGRQDWRQNSKKNFKNLTPGATKNSVNVTKRIIKKAFLEPKFN